METELETKVIHALGFIEEACAALVRGASARVAQVAAESRIYNQWVLERELRYSLSIPMDFGQRATTNRWSLSQIKLVFDILPGGDVGYRLDVQCWGGGETMSSRPAACGLYSAATTSWEISPNWVVRVPPQLALDPIPWDAGYVQHVHYFACGDNDRGPVYVADSGDTLTLTIIAQNPTALRVRAYVMFVGEEV